MGTDRVSHRFGDQDNGPRDYGVASVLTVLPLIGVADGLHYYLAR